MALRVVIAANLVYAIALLVLGVVPELPGATRGVPDGAAHALAAAVQAGLLFALLVPRVGRGRAAALAAVGAVLYGGFVESLQVLQPARTVELQDLAANALGAGAAASVAWFACRPTRISEGG